MEPDNDVTLSAWYRATRTDTGGSEIISAENGYVLRALESAETWDLYSGMIKSVVFAWIIITVACNAGLNVEGGAEGVGQATTTAVVQSLLAMLVMNALLTGVFFFAA